MSTRVMTALAKLRWVADQKFGVITPMRCMTVEAIFIDGRMLKHKWPPLLGVTFVTEFVYRVGLDLFVTKGAMRIMTAGTLDQSLFDRMMGLPGGLRTYIFMAFET